MNKPLENPARPEGTWSDVKLERFLIGELSAEESRRIAQSLAADPALAKRLKALESERAAVMAASPSERMAAGIGSRLRRAEAAGHAAARDRAESASSAPDFLSWFKLPQPRVWGPAFGMLAVLAVLPFTPYSPFATSGKRGGPVDETLADGKGGERLKGIQPRLFLHRKLDEGSVKLGSGESAKAGDVIQIQYESVGRSQGVIFSLDAEGNVTRHFPESGSRSASLRDGGPVALGYSYELDDAAGWERFYFITSDKPFDIRPVEQALRHLRPGLASEADSLSLPKELGQSLFILVKESGT